MQTLSSTTLTRGSKMEIEINLKRRNQYLWMQLFWSTYGNNSRHSLLQCTYLPGRVNGSKKGARVFRLPASCHKATV